MARRWPGCNLATVSGFALLLSSGLAHASGGFALLFDDVVSAGQGFAGSEAQTQWAGHRNPAVSASLDGSSVVFGGSLVRYETAFSGQATRSATDGSDVGGGNGGNPGRLDLPLPDIAWMRPIGDQFGVGIGLSAPFGVTLKFDDDWRGRYHAIDTAIRGPELVPSVAWRASDSVQIGVGLRLQGLLTEFSNDVDLGAIVQRRTEAQAGGDITSPACMASAQPTLPGKYDFRNTFEGVALGSGWIAGLQWQPNKATRLGVSYRSAISHDLKGDAVRERAGWTADDFRNDPCFAAVRLGLPLTGGNFEQDVVQPALAASASTEYFARFRIPPTLAFSAMHSAGRWTWSASLRHTWWSQFSNLTFSFANGSEPVTEPLRFSDSTMLGVGGARQVAPTWTLRAGLAYESSTVDANTRTARVPDAERRYVTVGASWQWSSALTIDVASGYLHGPARPVNDLAEASGSGNVLNGQFDDISLLYGSARLRWSFGQVPAKRANRP